MDGKRCRSYIRRWLKTARTTIAGASQVPRWKLAVCSITLEFYSCGHVYELSIGVFFEFIGRQRAAQRLIAEGYPYRLRDVDLQDTQVLLFELLTATKGND